MSDNIYQDAFKEACVKYPEAVSGLVWFATACGLFQSTLTMEHINWARAAMGKPLLSAAVVDDNK